MENTSCLNELKFCEVSQNHVIMIKDMLKISDFYLDKQKSFIPKNVPWIVLSSANRWPLDVLTFLIHGFGLAKQINKSTHGGQIQNNQTDIN